MAPARKVLIADPDLSPVRPLTKALRQRGYQVQYAPDGSKALEVAVLRHPDVILFDDRCTLIDARSIAQILGTNPRTDDIPLVITTASRDVEHLRTLKEGFLQKPYNLDEVLSRIDHLCRRSETARELRGDAREIEGGLAQLALADLLQILAMNRRTGRLQLMHGQERGEIHLANGRPVNARFGDVEGEKALFRLIAWKEGSFAFTPTSSSARPRIDRSMEEALLEGMRQSDERDRLLSTLPPRQRVLTLAPGGPPPVDPHPVTAEVIRALAQPRRLSDVMDLAEAPDLEVLAAVAALIQRGVVQRFDGMAPADGPLLATAEVHAVRGRLMRTRAARASLVGKVLVCGTGPKAGRWLLRSLPGLVATGNEAACVRSSFGTLGHVELGEALRIDVTLVPTAEAARPLWRPFATSALGALVLETTEPVLAFARYCAFELRLPLVIASRSASPGSVEHDSVPPALRGAPAGVSVVSSDISAALRSLLLATLHGQTLADGSEIVARHGA
ncbi:MAG: DUF4388 domain-containing protein [Archangium sp.]|nr:DUF4388 domain-containing protein [Archangium sp.]